MRDVFGSATDGTGDADDRNPRSPVAAEHDGATDTPTRDARDGGLTRRQSLLGAGTLALGATAGCLDAVPLADDTREPVEPEAPGDDPDATPAEFYYMLEDNGIVVDELYFDTEDRDLILFYESTAETHDESDEEIGLIYVIFRDGMVDRGADVNRLFTEVVDGFDDQVEGWGVNSEWAEQDLEGEVDYLSIWNQIVSTMVYPDGLERSDVVGPDDDRDSAVEIGADEDSLDDDSGDDGMDDSDAPADDDGADDASTDEGEDNEDADQD